MLFNWLTQEAKERQTFIHNVVTLDLAYGAALNITDVSQAHLNGKGRMSTGHLDTLSRVQFSSRSQSKIGTMYIVFIVLLQYTSDELEIQCDWCYSYA